MVIRSSFKQPWLAIKSTSLSVFEAEPPPLQLVTVGPTYNPAPSLHTPLHTAF